MPLTVKIDPRKRDSFQRAGMFIEILPAATELKEGEEVDVEGQPELKLVVRLKHEFSTAYNLYVLGNKK